MTKKEMKETIIKNSKKPPKENIIKNFDAITNMTKWQRMRFAMLVSAGGALVRTVTMVVFVAIAIIVATELHGQRWYNWKNDERVNELRTNLEFMQSKVEVMQERIDFLEGNARIRPANAWQFPMDAHPSLDGGAIAVKRTRDEGTPPYKAMRHYWREDEHPPTEENTTFLSDELFDRLNNWMWKHHPTEFFICSFLIVGTLFILLFEGPMALIKILFGKDDKEEKQEPEGEPTAEELAKIGMTSEEWKAQNLDNIYTPEAPEIEKPKEK